MATLNDQIYYESEENHGTYVYETLENLVNNFRQLYCHDNSVLGNTPRHLILTWMKKGMQQFSFDALREVKAVELELLDTLDIILPPDFVSYVRISWLDEQTGEFRPMSINTRANTVAISYLQDHNAHILFDDQGIILEGTSATELVNSGLNDSSVTCRTLCEGYDYEAQKWGLNTDRNHNGTFNINTRQGRIHFSSNVASKIIILEYISDGLEYSAESDIRVNKMAEMALYAYVNYNLLGTRLNVPEYTKRGAKKEFDTLFRNAKIKLMGIRIAEMAQMLKQGKRWIR